MSRGCYQPEYLQRPAAETEYTRAGSRSARFSNGRRPTTRHRRRSMTKSGEVRDCQWTTGRHVENTLVYGLRGSRGGSSIAKPLAKLRGQTSSARLPILGERQFFACADARFEWTHYCAKRAWLVGEFVARLTAQPASSETDPRLPIRQPSMRKSGCNPARCFERVYQSASLSVSGAALTRQSATAGSPGPRDRRNHHRHSRRWR